MLSAQYLTDISTDTEHPATDFGKVSPDNIQLIVEIDGKYYELEVSGGSGILEDGKSHLYFRIGNDVSNQVLA